METPVKTLLLRSLMTVAALCFFVLSLLTRIVPSIDSDRGVYVSIAERLIAGDRLYVDVWDNKDPLFYYLVALQRMGGPALEYGFELLYVAGAGVLAGLMARKLHKCSFLVCAIISAATVLIVSGADYDRGGTMPAGIFFSLLATYLASTRNFVASGIALALTFFVKALFVPPAAIMILGLILSTSQSESAATSLGKTAFAAIASVASICLFMVMRGEFDGYIAMQSANFVYSQENVFNSFGALQNIANHLATAWQYGWAALMAGLCAAIQLALMVCKPDLGRRDRILSVSILAVGCVSIGLVALTLIWKHHLGLLFPFFIYFIVLTVPMCTWPGPNLRHLPKWGYLVVPALLVLSCSSLQPYSRPVGNPVKFGLALSSLSALPAEAVALRRAAGNHRISYARLGTNNDQGHAMGTRSYALRCPLLFQYPFYSEERLSKAVNCASRADFVIVNLPTAGRTVPPDWAPKRSDVDILDARWNRFQHRAKRMLASGFECTAYQPDLMICARITQKGGFQS